MKFSKVISITIDDIFLEKIDVYYSHFTYLNGNKSKRSLIAVGVGQKFISKDDFFDDLNQFVSNSNNWVFGYLPYDLKNQLEPQLNSTNEDFIEMENYHLYIPKLVIEVSNKEIIAHSSSETTIDDFLATMNKSFSNEKSSYQSINLKQKVDRETYLKNVKGIKEHIQLGNIYEMNYCHEFYAPDASIDPIETYLKLNELTQAPFSCLYKNDKQYILSASPERFLKKEGETILSQPIKGTAKRGSTKQEDDKIKTDLENDPKERSENIMIVDLVRNDLSKTAAKGSVEVKELCKVYTFDTVHQMISTVTSRVNQYFTGIDVIKHAFPMGSMTGAPKVSAMEIIEQYENSKRGIYSGTVGYIKPNGDFDFNVVIRSILLNQESNKLSFMVGGAITLKSDPEKEYEETLLKAKALKKALKV